MYKGMYVILITFNVKLIIFTSTEMLTNFENNMHS